MSCDARFLREQGESGLWLRLYSSPFFSLKTTLYEAVIITQDDGAYNTNKLIQVTVIAQKRKEMNLH